MYVVTLPLLPPVFLLSNSLLSFVASSTFNYFLLAKLFIFLSVRLSCALNKVFLAALHAFRDGPSGRRPPDPPLRRGRRRCCPWI
jgi:hypothetical protein